MTIKQWQKNGELVAWADHLFRQGNWTLLLSVLEDIHPRHTQLPPVASDSVKSTALGEIYGYDKCLNNLDQLTKQVTEHTAVEPDFGADAILAAQHAPLTKAKVNPNK